MPDDQTQNPQMALSGKLEIQNCGLKARLATRPDAPFQFDELVEHLTSVFNSSIARFNDENAEPSGECDDDIPTQLYCIVGDVSVNVQLTLSYVPKDRALALAAELPTFASDFVMLVAQHVADPFGDEAHWAELERLELLAQVREQFGDVVADLAMDMSPAMLRGVLDGHVKVMPVSDLLSTILGLHGPAMN
ncbi:MAG: hypothetical protein EOM03_19140 [Clostridia bacterium]|nr:hypothetical protein [Clostridia bacterium]